MAGIERLVTFLTKQVPKAAADRFLLRFLREVVDAIFTDKAYVFFLR